MRRANAAQTGLCSLLAGLRVWQKGRQGPSVRWRTCVLPPHAGGNQVIHPQAIRLRNLCTVESERIEMKVIDIRYAFIDGSIAVVEGRPGRSAWNCLYFIPEDENKCSIRPGEWFRTKKEARNVLGWRAKSMMDDIESKRANLFECIGKSNEAMEKIEL